MNVQPITSVPEGAASTVRAPFLVWIVVMAILHQWMEERVKVYMWLDMMMKKTFSLTKKIYISLIQKILLSYK